MNELPTRPLGKTGLQVTVLGVGCAWLGRRPDGSIDEETGLAAILAALDSGVRLIDTASMYVADFLRVFGKADLDAVLLEESGHSEPISSREVRWYQPVLNVAGHFRWDIGLRFPTAAAYSGGESGFDFFIAPRPIPGPPCGLSLNDDFWLNGELPRNSPFVFWNIPEDGHPEQVLDRLSLLRSNGLINE